MATAASLPKCTHCRAMCEHRADLVQHLHDNLSHKAKSATGLPKCAHCRAMFEHAADLSAHLRDHPSHKTRRDSSTSSTASPPPAPRSTASRPASGTMDSLARAEKLEMERYFPSESFTATLPLPGGLKDAVRSKTVCHITDYFCDINARPY
jgi:hypothetical protein